MRRNAKPSSPSQFFCDPWRRSASPKASPESEKENPKNYMQPLIKPFAPPNDLVNLFTSYTHLTPSPPSSIVVPVRDLASYTYTRSLAYSWTFRSHRFTHQQARSRIWSCPVAKLIRASSNARSHHRRRRRPIRPYDILCMIITKQNGQTELRTSSRTTDGWL